MKNRNSLKQNLLRENPAWTPTFALSILCGLLAVPPAFAATDTWTGASDANLATAGNWSPNGTPANLATLLFSSADPSGTALNNNLTGTGQTNALSFSNTAPAYTITGNVLPTAGGIFITNASTTSLQSIGLNIIVGGSGNVIGDAGGGTTVSGIISGPHGLSKWGSGTVTLSGVNTFNNTGSTVGQGTLNIAGAGVFSGAGLAINSGAVFSYSSSASETILANGTTDLTGAGSVVVNGPGTLTCAATNTYTGTTTINGGKLSIVAWNTGNGAMTVNDGATLDVRAYGSSQLTPATLTLGSSLGATNEFLVVSSTTTAPVKATTLTLNGVNTINILSGGFAAGNSYPLINYTTLSGAGSYVLGTLPTGVTGTLGTASSTISLNVTTGGFYLDASDAAGASSFNSGLNWAGGTAPAPGNPYLTGAFLLRTPQNTTSLAFLGNSLEVQSGGTLRDKTAAAVITVTNLILDNAATLEMTQPNGVNNNSAAGTLAGAINLTGGTANFHSGLSATPDVAGETFTISANISGTGGITTAGSDGIIILSGNNTFSGGATIVSSLPARPATLQLGNANAVSNSTVTISSANGLTFSPGIAAFNVGGLTDAGQVIPESLTNTAGAGVVLVVGGNNSTETYSGSLTDLGSLTKTGTGTLTLSGVNTYTGATTVSAGGGLVIGGAGQLGAGTYAGAITDNGTLTYSSSAAQTFSGGLAGSGALVQSGPGTLDVTSTGSLGTVTVNDGTTLDVTAAGASQLAVSNYTLGNSLGATNEFLAVSSTITAPVMATTLTLNGANTINIFNSSLAIGIYPLISYGTLAGGGSITIGTLPTSAGGYIITNGNTISLKITSSAPTVWTGAHSGEWDIATTANWSFNGASSVYADGATVQFGDAGVSQFSLDLAANVAPGGMTFNNSAHNYTLGSLGGFSIGGSSGLTLTGSGSVTLNTLNTFTGPTVISSGQLVIGGNGQLGAGTYSAPITITNHGLLNYNSASAQTLSGAISGNGAVMQGGSGTLTLSGADTYTGSTTVTNGELALTTANTTSQVTVNDNGILDITISGASQLSPTNLTLGSSSGATAEFLQVSSLTAAPVNVQTLTLNGTSTINVLSGTFVAGYNYPLIQYATLSGGGNCVMGTYPADVIASLSTSNNTIYLNIIPVTFTLTGNDALAASSFNSAGLWSPNLAPLPGDIYLTSDFLLRTPQNTIPITFAGGSLEVQSGGALRDKTQATVTITNLIIDDGGALELSEPNGATGVNAVGTLAGMITLSGGTAALLSGLAATPDPAGTVFTISAPISGPGGLSTSGGEGTTILTSANNFSGGLTIVSTVASLNYVQLANTNAVTDSVVTINSTNGLTFSPGIGAFNIGGLAGTDPEALADTNGGAVTLVVGTDNTNTTYSGVLSGLGGLTKVGAGTLTLSAVNTYTGATTVNGGTLDVTASAGAGAMVVNDGGTLDVTVSGTNQLSPASLTLGSSSGATNEFLSLYNTSLAPVKTGVLTLNGTTTINIIGGIFEVGSYPLISFTGLAGSGSIVLGNFPVSIIGANLTTNGNVVALNVSRVSPTIWTGNINNIWDINTTANWTFNGSSSVYLDGAIVLFNDGGANPNVSLSTNVYPTSVVVSNNSRVYSFSGGAIGGIGGLTKLGAGTLVLSNNNTYTGNTTINGGTLQLGVSNAIPGNVGDGNVNLAGGTLDLNTFSQTFNGFTGSGTVDTVAGGAPVLTLGNNNASSIFSGVIQNSAGSLALTQAGSGTLTLNNTCTYTGATTIEGGGTLIISGNNTNGRTPFVLTNASTLRFATNYTTSQGLTVSSNATDTEFIKVDTNMEASLQGLAGGSTGAQFVWLSGGGTLDLTNATSSFNAMLRANGITLIIDSNTILTDGNSTYGMQIGSGIVPGVPTNSTGILTVQGNGQLILTAQALRCGSDAYGGTGVLNVLGNGAVTVPSLYLPRQSTNTGIVNQSGGTVTTAAIWGGNNGYTGPWTGTYNLNGGTLAWGGAFLYGPNADGQVMNFNFNGGTLQFTAATSEGGWTAVNVMANGATIDTKGNAVSYTNALLAGDALGGGLTVLDTVGGGVLTLNGANTYTGNTTVNGGTLELALPTLAANSKVTVTNGAVLQLDFAVPNPVASLVLNGVNEAPGVYNNITSSPFITGPGSLLVTGVAAPPPVITRIGLSGTTLVISGTNGLAGAQYNVLTTTNLMLPLADWTVLPTNTFTAGNFTITNTVNAMAPQSFYIIRLP